jgi:hypothetical protein
MSSYFEKYLTIERKERTNLLQNEDFEKAFGRSYGSIGIVNSKPREYQKDGRHPYQYRKRINNQPYWKGYKKGKIGTNDKRRDNAELARKI